MRILGWVILPTDQMFKTSRYSFSIILMHLRRTGIFSPDRDPHPAVHEIKFLQQPIHLVKDIDMDGSEITVDSVENSVMVEFEKRSPFIQWSDVKLEAFTTMEEIRLVNHVNSSANYLEGDMNDRCTHCVHLEYDSTCRDICRVAVTDFDDSEHFWLNFRWYRRNQVSWEDNAKPIPIATAKVRVYNKLKHRVRFDHDNYSLIESSIKVQETMDSLEFWCRDEGAKYFVRRSVLDKNTGMLVSFCDTNGDEILVKPMRPNFTRAATDNDRGGMDRLKGT